jgi:hypothetical protein
MQDKSVWIGVAVLALSDANPKRAEGFVGAFAGFASCAATVSEAVAILDQEFREAGYVLLGVDYMLPVERLDRELTAYECELLRAAEEYPVQFKDVHLHKGDG